MLFLSLGLSGLLLAAVNRIAFRSSKYRRPKIIWLCLMALIGPPFFALALLPVAILSVLLIVSVFLWKESRRGPAFFGALSLGSTLVAFSLPTALAVQNGRDYARLRLRYPFESMEGRLPIPKPIASELRSGPETLGRLDSLEGEVYGDGIRTWRLKRLHEDAVGLFVDSFGFGVGRMIPTTPTESNLTFGLRGGPGPLQPGPRAVWASSPGAWMPIPAVDEEPLGRLHEEGVVDFVNATGFGYFMDRRHVAGFQSHGFRAVPKARGTWELASLDLVGLLLEDEPRVYVSSHLPAMDELRGVPTRSPDAFETVGLNALRRGDDLFLARDGDRARMLGSIRSLKQCVACHGGERGDLLGAFSYTLRRD